MDIMADQRKVWWQQGVIYQIYPRSYQDSNGDGIGDIPGILHRLDYLSDTLGVDAIWLSPFYPSPMKDFGYDVAEYCNVDPMFGTLADFETLVAEAHKRNIQVVIDFVPNHSSDMHPWFRKSRASRDNPMRDWYVWRDAKADGSPPNNWLSLFGGNAWEWDEKTRQFYLHSFLKEQPDLNWRNPDVKKAMFDAVRFWLKRGVDGFRLDVAHFIMKDPQERDNPLNPDLNKGDFLGGKYASQVHLYDKGHADVHGVLREFRAILDSFDAVRPRYSVGEIHLFDWKAWAKYYGEKLDELHMPFNFSLMRAAFNPKALREVVDALEANLPTGAWPNYVLGNHDEPRLASRYGKAGARLAAMLLLTLRGTPTLYQGDELGMENVDIPPEKIQDPAGIGVPGMGRDRCRTPMQWNPGPHAGFSYKSTRETWLPLSPKNKEENVEVELRDSRSFLNLYRQLLALRRTSPALAIGSYQAVDGTPESVYAYWREEQGEKVLVALNFAGTPVEVKLSGTGTLLCSTALDRQEVVDLTHLSLRAHEGVVIDV
jgi:alpha-glucosidase